MSKLEEKIRVGVQIWGSHPELIERIATMAEEIAHHGCEQEMSDRFPGHQDTRDARYAQSIPIYEWEWLEENANPTAQIVNQDGELVRTIS